ncbi:biosynthetic arginine decarboxylase [Vallitalea maricola]|uniref:Biosynthetic arginine decarboxylase n=1 Tax=Vallitalea maricola TaxID=3074433 RepID=A0ACB5UIN5_9FIRM|nr:biosynthetic arginine decarboxylase [Vallitalea sp. AN17-2]
MKRKEILNRWDIKKSEELYGVNNWGRDYFTISETGELIINPFTKESSGVSLIDIIQGVEDRGFDMPVLLRFENILDEQISSLNNAFNNAIESLEYKGSYRGVYPIKVNQQQQVVHEIAKFGQRYHHGFEVGSKAELIAVMTEMKDKEANIICNGYKDSEFIDLGLYAIKMGYNLFFVIEMPGEVELILDRGKLLGVKPNIGIRIKLSTKAGGHWTESGGDRSIFGLNMSQVIEILDYLKEKGMLECLKLMHYHLGSQIPNIRDIRVAVLEAARVYAELVKEGAPMGYLDLGGGLAVDYDGSNTNFTSSRNYNIDEYCIDVIEAVMSVMDKDSINHPIIITESGRAIVAYYSILVFNVLDVTKFEQYDIPEELPEETPENIKNLFEVYKNVSIKNLQESYNDALYYRDLIKDMFNHNNISLRERALSEKIYWDLIYRVSNEIHKLKFVPSELIDLDDALADIYYCNFSVFQSIPDSWAIDQLFPIMPIHRLNEEPTRNAVIADITCDCDGEINKFIDLHDVKKTLPLHELRVSEDYYIGTFLVGAYQETLGDLHNLFGDTNVVSIRLDGKGSYEFINEIQGDTVEDVLSYVEYNTKDLRASFRENAETAVKAGLITAKERKSIMESFEAGLRGYTYYER